VRSDADRLDDILTAAKIQERIGAGLDYFQRDEMLQVRVIHYLQVIGEAARGITQELKERFPDVPWAQTIALRNILVHEYFGLNMHQVWTMTQKDLPSLEGQVRAIRLQMQE